MIKCRLYIEKVLNDDNDKDENEVDYYCIHEHL